MIEGAPAERTPNRSAFVTAVGWVFLAFSAIGTFIGILQNVMFATIFPSQELHRAASSDPEFTRLPPFFRFFMAHPWLWFALALLVSATTLVASIGLLRRRNWARCLFIGILGAGVAWFVGSLFLAWQMFSSGPFRDKTTPAEFGGFLVVMQVFMAIFAIGLATLFIWMIRKLLSSQIREEFRA